jgi:hypothetical protein
VQLYNSLAKGADGNAFPGTDYKRTTVVARTGANDPTTAANLERVNGSFVFAPSMASAKAIYDRLTADKPVPVKGPLLTAYNALDKSGDAFGVALNQKGTFTSLLKTVPGADLQAIRNKVGSDRLDKIVGNTKMVVWAGNVTGADTASGQVVATMNNAAAAAEAVTALNEGKTSINTTTIPTFNVSSAGETVTVSFSVANIKQTLLDMLTKQ